MKELSVCSTTSMSRATMSSEGGCACKLPPSDLQELGISLENTEDCEEMQGHELLMTTEINNIFGYNTHIAGKIALIHAISDIYAVGGRPLFATFNFVVGKELSFDQMRPIMDGAREACKSENIQTCGGHTIHGEKTLFGVTVVGEKPQLLRRKKGATEGQHILISPKKKLGVGIIARGFKTGLLEKTDLDEATTQMCISNKDASILATNAGIKVSTDITGFGFLGHLSEILRNNNLGAIILANKIPFFEKIDSLSRNIFDTKWIRNNYDYVSDFHKIKGIKSAYEIPVVFDPQTSGGLIVIANSDQALYLTNNGFIDVGYTQKGGDIIII